MAVAEPTNQLGRWTRDEGCGETALDSSSPRADLTERTPQIVLGNPGDNDDSSRRGHGQPGPSGYTHGYGALAPEIRAVDPVIRGSRSSPAALIGDAQSRPVSRIEPLAVSRIEGHDGSSLSMTRLAGRVELTGLLSLYPGWLLLRLEPEETVPGPDRDCHAASGIGRNIRPVQIGNRSLHLDDERAGTAAHIQLELIAV